MIKHGRDGGEAESQASLESRWVSALTVGRIGAPAIALGIGGVLGAMAARRGPTTLIPRVPTRPGRGRQVPVPMQAPLGHLGALVGSGDSEALGGCCRCAWRSLRSVVASASPCGVASAGIAARRGGVG